MEIKWYGETCFSIKGEEAQVIINPYKDIKTLLRADMVLVSDNKNYAPEIAQGMIIGIEQETKPVKVFDWPGEFEVGGIWSMAIPYQGSSIFSLIVDDIKVCHLDNLTEKLTDDVTEKIGEVDVLLVPVSDKEFTPKKAQAIIELIEPRVVIPMIGPFKTFLKEIGHEKVEERPSYKIQSRAGLPKETMDVVPLTPIL